MNAHDAAPPEPAETTAARAAAAAQPTVPRDPKALPAKPTQYVPNKRWKSDVLSIAITLFGLFYVFERSFVLSWLYVGAWTAAGGVSVVPAVMWTERQPPGRRKERSPSRLFLSRLAPAAIEEETMRLAFVMAANAALFLCLSAAVVFRPGALSWKLPVRAIVAEGFSLYCVERAGRRAGARRKKDD